MKRIIGHVIARYNRRNPEDYIDYRLDEHVLYHQGAVLRDRDSLGAKRVGKFQDDFLLLMPIIEDEDEDEE